MPRHPPHLMHLLQLAHNPIIWCSSVCKALLLCVHPAIMKAVAGRQKQVFPVVLLLVVLVDSLVWADVWFTLVRPLHMPTHMCLQSVNPGDLTLTISPTACFCSSMYIFISSLHGLPAPLGLVKWAITLFTSLPTLVMSQVFNSWCFSKQVRPVFLCLLASSLVQNKSFWAMMASFS